jgi:eukaryotic-like serine/threonine-protein kinase
MIEDRKQRLREIFDGAIRREGSERASYIEHACTGDPQMAREVQSLVAAFTHAGDQLDGTNEAATRSMAQPASTLAIGGTFAKRYLILAKLGEGGMGAVFKAHDEELNRDVALKVIRGELLSSMNVLQRFRMEVVLAQKIAHRNVVRIFDLGVVDDDRFFTMEFVEGKSLWSMLKEKGRLEPAEAAAIMTQVADGLSAAHAAGVIHRDLKPPNIMVGTDGRVVVMDFGIARSLENTGVTRLGDVIGTPDYMAPEHARGEIVDAKCDIFSLGIIFYELLLGKLPFAQVAQVGMVKRTEIPAPSPCKEDPAIPAGLSRIVDQCLALDPNRRYPGAAELVADLVLWQRSVGIDSPITQVVVGTAPSRTSRRRIVGAAAAAALLGAGGAWFGIHRWGNRTPRTVNPVTLLIADFDNQTGDSQFDGSLEPMFALAMEDASFINCFDRKRAQQVAAQVRHSDYLRLDRETARLVAVREGIPVVVSGEILHQGDRYVLKVQTVNSADGASILDRQAEANTKNAMLKVVTELAAPVRGALGDKAPAQHQFAAETYTAGSLEAAYQYARAQNLALMGKWDDAIPAYQETIRLDPRMGRAYAGLATVYRNIGRTDEAVEQFKHALEYIDRMSERERFRTRGGYFVTVNNPVQAVEQYKQLVAKFPADTAGHANLALSYLLLRDTTKALEEGRAAVRIHPGNLAQRNNVALYAMYAGNFDESIREATVVLKQDPSFAKAHVATAIGNLALGRRVEAIDEYQRLTRTTPLGEAMGVIGLADAALYEGRAKEAAAMLEKALAAPDAPKAPLAARKQLLLAEALLALGKKSEALAAGRKAAGASGSYPVRVPAALVALAAGDSAPAEATAKELDAELTDEMSGYARILEAERQRQHGQAQDAVRKASDAVKSLNLWLGQYYLGRAYLDAKMFPEAQKAFEACLSRSGEATAVFMDDLPSYRYVAPLHYYAGLAAAGLGGSGREEFEKFASLRQRADFDDPLLADAKKRLAGR